jgi:tetratricopeptide (TPR) repeat protein
MIRGALLALLLLQIEEPESLYQRGVESYNAGQLDEAVRLLRTAVARRPNVADYRYALGLAYLKAGQAKEAAQELEAVLGMTGLRRSTRVKEIEVLVQCGTAYLQLGNLKTARSRLQVAVARQPDLAEAQYALGIVEQREGRLDKALERFEAALGSQPTHARAALAAATLLREKGRSAEALERLRAAARLDSGSFDVHMALGLAAFESGLLEEAASAFELALGLDPADKNARFNLGAALLARKEYAKAVEALEPLIAAGQPPNDGAVFNLAQAYRGAGRTAEALRTLEALAERSPERPHLQFTLGVLREESGDGDGAEKAYRKAIAQRPEELPPYLNLAALLEKSGRKPEALELLNLALAQAPAGPEAERIRTAVAALQKSR